MPEATYCMRAGNSWWRVPSADTPKGEWRGMSNGYYAPFASLIEGDVQDGTIVKVTVEKVRD